MFLEVFTEMVKYLTCFPFFFLLVHLVKPSLIFLSYKKTHAFFEAATYGFQPTIRTDDLVSIFTKQSASEYDRLILFLELIKLLSVNSKKLLTTGLFTQILSEHEGKRMSEIMDLILTNFHKKLSLEDAVTTANMTKTAFVNTLKTGLIVLFLTF